eukprot:9098396-Karenia_brevis.AAC.1
MVDSLHIAISRDDVASGTDGVAKPAARRCKAVCKVENDASSPDLGEGTVGVAKPNDAARSASEESVDTKRKTTEEPDNNSICSSSSSNYGLESDRDAAKALGDEVDHGEGLEKDNLVKAMKSLRTTTSVHDDWLHRGPYLHDMPWH